MMKRQKTENYGKPHENFWPVPGVDGEPYPPVVQEALDLVEEETKRRKILECKHQGRYPRDVYPGWEGIHSRPYHVCACRDCGADRIACLPNEVGNDRWPGALEEAISRMLKRRLEEQGETADRVLLHNAKGEAVLTVLAEDRAPDLSWVRTMNGRKTL